MDNPLLELPDDVAEAYDSMKLVILRHRLDGWQEISADQMVLVLYALQQMALESPSAHGG